MLRKLAGFYLPIFLFLLVMNREVITVLFTAQYESSWPIFAINLTMIPLGLMASGCDPVIRAYAEHRFFMMKVRAVVIGALSVALWFGTRRFGLIGAITVVVLFNLIERCIIAAKVGQILGVTRRDIGLLKDVFRMALAAFVAGAATWCLRYSGLDSRPLGILGVCGIAFLVVYVATLVLLGVLTTQERTFVERWIGRITGFLWGRTALPMAAGAPINVGYPIWRSEPGAATAAPRAVSSPIIARNQNGAIDFGELTQRRYWDS